MLPGVNPRQMRQAMKKMGLEQEELDVSQVIFKLKDRELVCNRPQVSKINMMGQESFQVVGDFEESALDTAPDISEEDIQTIIDQTGCSKEEAENALKASKGDLAEAIMGLQE